MNTKTEAREILKHSELLRIAEEMERMDAEDRRVLEQLDERFDKALDHWRILGVCIALGVAIIGGKAMFDWLVSVIGG